MGLLSAIHRGNSGFLMVSYVYVGKEKEKEERETTRVSIRYVS